MSRTFPEKLHELLKKIEEEGLEHIISWQPHGRCFAIHKKDQFVNEVMPRFFMQTKLTSFQRQLNLYGTPCLFFFVSLRYTIRFDVISFHFFVVVMQDSFASPPDGIVEGK